MPTLDQVPARRDTREALIKWFNFVIATAKQDPRALLAALRQPHRPDMTSPGVFGQTPSIWKQDADRNFPEQKVDLPLFLAELPNGDNWPKKFLSVLATLHIQRDCSFGYFPTITDKTHEEFIRLHLDAQTDLAMQGAPYYALYMLSTLLFTDRKTLGAEQVETIKAELDNPAYPLPVEIKHTLKIIKKPKAFIEALSIALQDAAAESGHPIAQICCGLRTYADAETTLKAGKHQDAGPLFIQAAELLTLGCFEVGKLLTLYPANDALQRAYSDAFSALQEIAVDKLHHMPQIVVPYIMAARQVPEVLVAKPEPDADEGAPTRRRTISGAFAAFRDRSSSASKAAARGPKHFVELAADAAKEQMRQAIVGRTKYEAKGDRKRTKGKESAKGKTVAEKFEGAVQWLAGPVPIDADFKAYWAGVLLAIYNEEGDRSIFGDQRNEWTSILEELSRPSDHDRDHPQYLNPHDARYRDRFHKEVASTAARYAQYEADAALPFALETELTLGNIVGKYFSSDSPSFNRIMFTNFVAAMQKDVNRLMQNPAVVETPGSPEFIQAHCIWAMAFAAYRTYGTKFKAEKAATDLLGIVHMLRGALGVKGADATAETDRLLNVPVKTRVSFKTAGKREAAKRAAETDVDAEVVVAQGNDGGAAANPPADDGGSSSEDEATTKGFSIYGDLSMKRGKCSRKKATAEEEEADPADLYDNTGPTNADMAAAFVTVDAAGKETTADLLYSPIQFVEKPADEDENLEAAMGSLKGTFNSIDDAGYSKCAATETPHMTALALSLEKLYTTLNFSSLNGNTKYLHSKSPAFNAIMLRRFVGSMLAKIVELDLLKTDLSADPDLFFQANRNFSIAFALLKFLADDPLITTPACAALEQIALLLGQRIDPTLDQAALNTLLGRAVVVQDGLPGADDDTPRETTAAMLGAMGGDPLSAPAPPKFDARLVYQDCFDLVDPRATGDAIDCALFEKPWTDNRASFEAMLDTFRKGEITSFDHAEAFAATITISNESPFAKPAEDHINSNLANLFVATAFLAYVKAPGNEAMAHVAPQIEAHLNKHLTTADALLGVAVVAEDDAAAVVVDGGMQLGSSA